MLSFRSIPAALIATVLIAVYVAMPLFWLGHETLEAREDAHNDAVFAAAVAQGQTPHRTEEHHDESRCNVCQSVAAVRGHMTTPVAPFSILILQRVHEAAAVRIVAEREPFRETLAHPRGPPAIV